MTLTPLIEQMAQNLLHQYRLKVLPIPVLDVAKCAGVNLFPFDLGVDVSGVLNINNGVATIGYNPSESKVRQRFTISHELGHYFLHFKKDGRNKEKNKVFVDNENYYQFIMFRSQKPKMSSEDYKHEQEANSFAAALLMPQELVQKELEIYSGFDLSDSAMVTDLAKKFEVSTQAISFRIINLAQNNLL
jgi:Zn-dependent peptidase ImmA (M78 family)